MDNTQEAYLISLVYKAKQGDDASFDKILKALDSSIKKIAGQYYINGMDRHDVIQTGRLGLYKAIRDYDEDTGMTFKHFALNICVKRNIQTAVMAANRKKYENHNKAISLEAPVISDDESMQSIADYIPDEEMPMDNMYVIQEEFDYCHRALEIKLTALEKKIYHEFMHEPSYRVIANNLNIKPKAVDNALMRIRKKANGEYKTYQGKEKMHNFALSNNIGFSTSYEIYVKGNPFLSFD